VDNGLFSIIVIMEWASFITIIAKHRILKNLTKTLNTLFDKNLINKFIIIKNVKNN